MVANILIKFQSGCWASLGKLEPQDGIGERNKGLGREGPLPGLLATK